MANVFIKPETIVRMGLGMLQRELILPRLVTTLAKADFVGAKNDTVNIRIPARLTAREYGFRNNRSSPIVLDELNEMSIPITLNKDPYSAVRITDEELTLDIADFGDQVLGPQVRAVAEKLEGYIAATMTAGTYGTELDLTEGDDDYGPRQVMIDARKALNRANVPTVGRFLVLGANVEAEFLNTDLFIKANEAGATDALREAILGRLFGFTVIGNVNSIDPDEAYAGHSTAFGFANFAPDVPDGVVAGAGMAYEGLAMRWIRDYDATVLADRSVVSSFAGTVSVQDEVVDGDLTGNNVRAVKINFTPTGS